MFRKLVVFTIAVLMSVTLVPTVYANEKTQWNFEDNNVDDWVGGGQGPDFSVGGGELTMSGGDAWAFCPVRRQNFILEADVTQQAGHTGLIFRANEDGSNRSVVVISSELVKYFSFPDYAGTHIENTDIPIEIGTTYKLKISVNKDTLKIWVDDALVMTRTISLPVDGEDHMGVFQYSGTATFDNFNVSEWNENGTGVVATTNTVAKNTSAPSVSVNNSVSATQAAKTPTPVSTKLSTPVPASNAKNSNVNEGNKNKYILPIIIVVGVLALGSASAIIIIKKKKIK